MSAFFAKLLQPFARQLEEVYLIRCAGHGGHEESNAEQAGHASRDCPAGEMPLPSEITFLPISSLLLRTLGFREINSPIRVPGPVLISVGPNDPQS